MYPKEEVMTNTTPASIKFSTQDIPAVERGDWWREIICRHYANVDIISPVDETFHSETRIFPLNDVQLSNIRSSAISIKKRPRDPDLDNQDTYLAVVLLSGRYWLEQHGREANLQPGDIAIYDAARQHRIDCPDDFAKLIFAIPRQILSNKFSMADACTATRIPSNCGIGAVASNFLRSWATEATQLKPHDLASVSDLSIDMLAMALASIKPAGFRRSRSQAFTLKLIKSYVEQNLSNPNLNTTLIASAVGLSPRQINALFAQEDISLMRYVLQRRLERCYQDIQSQEYKKLRISDIAFHWGFNDLSHFSRTFRQQFGLSARELQYCAKKN